MMFPSELGFINLNFDFFKKGFGFVKKSLELHQEELGASSRRAWGLVKKSLELY